MSGSNFDSDYVEHVHPHIERHARKHDPDSLKTTVGGYGDGEGSDDNGYSDSEDGGCDDY
eukprot:3902449-Pyramimonas_sp.AAC.1